MILRQYVRICPIKLYISEKIRLCSKCVDRRSWLPMEKTHVTETVLEISEFFKENVHKKVWMAEISTTVQPGNPRPGIGPPKYSGKYLSPMKNESLACGLNSVDIHVCPEYWRDFSSSAYYHSLDQEQTFRHPSFTDTFYLFFSAGWREAFGHL